MNTSDTVVGVLSDHLRELSVQALRNAAADGRRTVMDRDFAAVLGRK
jgi:histone H3/H4